MRTKTFRKTYVGYLLVTCFLWIFSNVADAQKIRIYDKERDDQAAAALKLAEALNNNNIFEAQLRNLATLSKKDFETEFLGIKLNINAQPLAINNWADAHSAVCQIEKQNNAEGLVPNSKEIEDAAKNIKDQIDKAKEELKKLKSELEKNEKTIDPDLVSLFEKLGDFSSFLQLTAELQQFKIVDADTVKSLNQTKEIIDIIQGVYTSYKTLIANYNSHEENLGGLRIALKKVALDSLQVDEDHWKKIAAIRMRREVERNEIRYFISRYKSYISRLQQKLNPQNKEDFCSLFDELNSREKNPNYWRLNQSLAESVKEVVEHARRLDLDNQEILRTAKTALVKINSNATEMEISAAKEATIAALDASVAHLNPKEAVHQYELEARMKQVYHLKQLRKIQSNDHSDLKKALQKILINGNDLAGNIGNGDRDGTIRDIAADMPTALYALASVQSSIH